MQLIAELYSEQYLKEFGDQLLPRELNVIKNVRGILKREDNLIALAYYDKLEFHALVGGGVESGEAPEVAILREVKEETGFDSEIIDEVGIIFEYRKGRKDGKWALIISYCYILKAVGDSSEIDLTESEKEIGFQLKWLPKDDALKNLKEDMLRTEKEGFKRERDYLFLSYP